MVWQLGAQRLGLAIVLVYSSIPSALAVSASTVSSAPPYHSCDPSANALTPASVAVDCWTLRFAILDGDVGRVNV